MNAAHEERVAQLRKRVGLPVEEPVAKARPRKAAAARVAGPVRKGTAAYRALQKRASEGYGGVSQAGPASAFVSGGDAALTDRLLTILEKHAENSGVTINENGSDLGALLSD